MKQVIKQRQLQAKSSRMEPSKVGMHQLVSMVIDLESVLFGCVVHLSPFLDLDCHEMFSFDSKVGAFP